MKASNPDILIRFGQTLRSRRTSRNMTQEALAEKADLHRTYIADIERGTRNVSLRIIEKLARALACPIAEFFSDVERAAK